MTPPIPPLPHYPPQPVFPAASPYPMTFGQILERIGHVLRSRWKTMAGIGVVPIAPFVVLEGLIFGGLYLAGVFKQPPTPPSTTVILAIVFPAGLLFVPLMFVMYGLYFGASSYAALQADNGLPVTVAQAYGHAWSKLGRYTWLMVLRSLIVMLPFVAIFIAGAAATGLIAAFAKGSSDAGSAALFVLIPLGMLLYLGALIYAIIMELRLSLAFCAAVHEGIAARPAITRSGVLTSGAKGRIFLVLLVVYAISYAAMMVFYFAGFIMAFIVAGLVGLTGMTAHSITPAGYVAIGLLGVCVGAAVIFLVALLMAAYSASFAVLYRDQCLRIDGPPALPAPVPSVL